VTRILYLVLFLIPLACSSVDQKGAVFEANAGEGAASPHFTGKEIPTPPMQKEPWTPPETKLADVVTSAVKLLFEMGFANPRGCEYSEIEIATGSCWSGDAGMFKTHGWVLPSKDGEKQRFAVCWNGLVYPLVSLGEKADCRKDVQALLKVDREYVDKQAAEHKAWEKPWFSKPDIRYDHALSENESASHRSMTRVKVVLLLRLGYGDLAEKLWSQWFAARENEASLDPYPDLAADWVWALFDRTVCAHMRGDDNLTLVGARALTAIEKSVKAAAEKRDFRGTNLRKESFLDFLKPLPDLLADQERRAKEPKYERVLEAGVEKFPDKGKRIAAIIRDLEEASARQDGQPGGVTLEWDPIVKALIGEGEDAVEPLLECLENDNRLTRSVRFHRDFFTHREIMPVSSAVFAALSGILGTREFGERLDTRREAAARIRAYWKKFKGVPVEERWCRVLADDTASQEQWLEAAASIVRPTDVTVEGEWITVPQRKPGERPVMRGEPLRGKKDTSVAELMAKRVENMYMHGEPGSAQEFSTHNSCRMALYLSDWDIAQALPTLKKMVDRCREIMGAYDESVGWSLQIPSSYIAEFTLERVRGKDPDALKDYTDWLRTTQPKMLEDYIRDVFKPAWRFPDEPLIAETTRWLFGSDESPWATLIKNGELILGYHYNNLVETPLIGVEVYREQLLKGLHNKDVAGRICITKDGYIDFGAHSTYRQGGLIWKVDPLAPKVGEILTYRKCDLTAKTLSPLEGTPKCELYWPQEKRDKAIEECGAFLKQYGERFRYAPNLPKRHRYWEQDGACISFQQLDHPASRDEVKKGLAIFSLEGEGEVRLWKMPCYPMEGEWTTLKDSPYTRCEYNSETKKNEVVITGYEQSGGIWQAEEVKRDGKWERYYGFVGRYTISKVPAAETEFPADYYCWSKLSRGIDCCLCPPGVSDWRKARGEADCEMGKPLIVTAWLRSRSGLEQTVPSNYYQSDPKQGPALLSGIDIKLEYTSEKTPTPYNPYKDQRKWEELKRTRDTHFEASGPGRTLSPTEKFKALEVDLNDWFDIRKPGYYCLRFVFHAERSDFAEGESQPALFLLRSPEEGKAKQ
jgi:hypothetical protein